MNDLDLKDLWQSTPVKSTPVLDVDRVKIEAHRFERKIRRRNVLEWLACAIIVGLHIRDLFESENLWMLLGNGTIVLGGAYIALVLWRRGRVTLDADPNQDTIAFIEAHATALEAQAKLLAKVPLWYLSPLALGIALQLVGRSIAAGKTSTGVLLAAGLVAVTFLGVAWLNIRSARKLNAEAGALRASLETRSAIEP